MSRVGLDKRRQAEPLESAVTRQHWSKDHDVTTDRNNIPATGNIMSSEQKNNWCVQGSKEQMRPEAARSKVKRHLQSLQKCKGQLPSLEDRDDTLDTHIREAALRCAETRRQGARGSAGTGQGFVPSAQQDGGLDQGAGSRRVLRSGQPAGVV